MKFWPHLYHTGRLLLRLGVRLLTIATVLMILLGIIGQIVRDLTVELGLLMYIPLLPLGLWAVSLDLLQMGRSFPRFRFGLTIIGVGVMTWGGISMMGMGGDQANLDPSTQISILHWNVRWGGRGKAGWNSIRQDIEKRHPDIAVISETPPKSRLNLLFKHKGWTRVMYEDTRSNPLAVCSGWPLKFERYVKIRHGKAMTVLVTVRGQPLRILAIDGWRGLSKKYTILSRPILPRSRNPLLTSIVQAVESNHARGQPIDIIAGDFNAISLSIGFDAFAYVGGGYNLASKFSRGWRGTWRSSLPLLDIDHVWVHKRFQGLRTEIFTHTATDHRGQLVQFQFYRSSEK